MLPVNHWDFSYRMIEAVEFVMERAFTSLIMTSSLRRRVYMLIQVIGLRGHESDRFTHHFL